jgi:hypothetical protein
MGALAGALVLAGCCPVGGVGSRLVQLRPQETANWCWAASTQMVTENLGHNIAQCDMANLRFGRTDCCSGTCPQNAACNMPGWTMFAEYGFTFDASAAPLSWDDLKAQICQAKKPMAFAYGPKSGGVGHVVVIRGFIESGASRSVLISDPWAPCTGTVRAITYDEYSSSQTVNHWQTTYNIARP